MASSGHWLASASSMRSLYFAVDVRAQLLQEGVRLGQVLAVGAFALVQIRHRVQPESVDAQIAARNR